TDTPPVLADSCTSVHGSRPPLSSYLGTSAAATVGRAGTSGAGWPAPAGWPHWSGRRDATGTGVDVAGVDVAGGIVAGGIVAGVDVAGGIVAGGGGVGGDPPHAVSTAQTPPSVTRATDDFTSGPPCWSVRPPAS